jgi:hypothetical protein
VVSKGKGLTLVFENCEEAFVPWEHVRGLVMDGVCKAYRKTSDTIFAADRADFFSIVLEKEADACTGGLSEKDGSLFERIEKFPDITQVVLNYEGRGEVLVYVPWLGTDYVNELQRVSREDKEGLGLKISKRSWG